MEAIMEAPAPIIKPAPTKAIVSVANPISAQVTSILGRIPYLIKITSTPVGKFNYRVNIWTGKNGDKYDPIISQSYFVIVDEKGEIAGSSPEMPHK